MLDFVLTVSLPKLIFGNEVCGQALHFCREIEILEELPPPWAGAGHHGI